MVSTARPSKSVHSIAVSAAVLDGVSTGLSSSRAADLPENRDY
jgi:hypothetical protein